MGLSIGRDIRQYMESPKTPQETPQEPLDTPLVTSHPLTKAQETHRLTKTDIARYYIVPRYWGHNLSIIIVCRSSKACSSGNATTLQGRYPTWNNALRPIKNDRIRGALQNDWLVLAESANRIPYKLFLHSIISHLVLCCFSANELGTS